MLDPGLDFHYGIRRVLSVPRNLSAVPGNLLASCSDLLDASDRCVFYLQFLGN